MSQTLRALLFLALTCWRNGAAAQSAEEPGADIFTQGLVAPNLDAEMGTPAETLAPPPTYTPPVSRGSGRSGCSGQHHRLVLEARLVADGARAHRRPRLARLQRPAGRRRPAAAGQPGRGRHRHPAARARRLSVHAAFGRAGATKRVTIADDDQMESLVLDAGGLELNAVVGDDQRDLAGADSPSKCCRQDETGELVTVVPKAAPGLVLRLSAGTYHVDQPLRRT